MPLNTINQIESLLKKLGQQIKDEKTQPVKVEPPKSVTYQSPQPKPQPVVDAPKSVVPDIPVMSHKQCGKKGCPNPSGVKCKSKKMKPCDDVPGCVLAATGKYGNNKSWSVCRARNPPKQGGRRRTRRRKRKRTRKKKNKKRRRTKKKRRRRR